MNPSSPDVVTLRGRDVPGGGEAGAEEEPGAGADIGAGEDDEDREASTLCS
jgi:hypothetical protein